MCTCQWHVHSPVTKYSDHFVWKDTSERVTRCWDDTSWQEASEFLFIKTPPFLREFRNKKNSVQYPRKCFHALLKSRFQNFETAHGAIWIDQLIQSQIFWEVVCFDGCILSSSLTHMLQLLVSWIWDEGGSGERGNMICIDNYFPQRRWIWTRVNLGNQNI